MRRSSLLATLLTLALLVGVAFKGRLLALPAVRGETVAGQFDTSRAVGRLQRILGDQRPHSVDTAANDAVRARIVAELQAIGASPRITDDFACNGAADARSVGCARVRNIIATIGPPGPGHLLLVSHYDSTPVGPGAADDGIGVAVMLEVAARLARRDLQRPVSLLFNEGEESGLIGARAFLVRDPLARRVSKLINLESRGVEGPAIMFETSAPNAPAIDWFSASVARPVANSLSTDFYKLIPNSTDVRVFEERPWTILNFAIIGNETRYHSTGDTVDALSLRSVQHMGDQALALAIEHASGGTHPATGGTRVFADLFGRHLVVLPLAVGLGGLGLLLATLAFLAWRRRPGIARALGATALALTSSATLAWAGHAAVGAIRDGEYWRAHPWAIGTAIMLTAALATAASLAWLARAVAPAALRAGYWLVFLALGAGISAVAPGASIFFLLPPLLAAIGLALGGRAARLLAIAAAVVLLLTWAPLVALVEILLDYDNGWIFAPLFALMLLPALIELQLTANADRPSPRRGVFALAMIALAGWIVVLLLPAYSADRKQAFGIEYAVDPGGVARWLVVNDGAPLPAAFEQGRSWSEGAEVPWSTRKRWATPAPAGLVPAPTIVPLGSRETTGGRVVSLRLNANGAETITLLAPPAAKIVSLSMGGWTRRMGALDKPAAELGPDDARQRYALRCQGRSCDGMRVDLTLARRAPVVWTVIGNRSGLPVSARPLLAARPANAAPQYTADATITVGTFKF